MNANDMLKSALESVGYVVLPPSMKPLVDELHRKEIYTVDDLDRIERNAVIKSQANLRDCEIQMVQCQFDIPNEIPEDVIDERIRRIITGEIAHYLEKNPKLIKIIKEEFTDMMRTRIKARFRFGIPTDKPPFNAFDHLTPLWDLKVMYKDMRGMLDGTYT